MTTEERVPYLAERLYVPEELVTSSMRNAYTYHINRGKKQSEEDPLIEEDDIETIQTFREYSTGWVGFARGDVGKLLDNFGHLKIHDARSVVPHGFDDLRFLATLTPDQLKVWREWKAAGFGMVKAPARWGKTVKAAHMIVKLKQRTLILAQEWTLLEQFEEEFRDKTNVNELEKQLGVKLIGGSAKDELQVYPIITLATWQSFLKPEPFKWLKDHRDAWGLTIIDEAHSSASDCFSRVVASVNSFWRVPFTATPKRKDHYESVVFDHAGPVTAEGTVEQLPVRMRIIRTGYSPIVNASKMRYFDTLCRNLSENKARNNLIIDKVISDLKEGHSVLVCSSRTKHLGVLKKLLEKKLPDIKSAILTGSILGQKRKDLRNNAKSGALQVVFAQARIVQQGWNVWRWSSLHNTIPMSNEGNWEQRTARVRTPCPTCPGKDNPKCFAKEVCQKLPPIVWDYVDDLSMCEAMLAVRQRVNKRLKYSLEYERVKLAPSKAQQLVDDDIEPEDLPKTKVPTLKFSKMARSTSENAKPKRYRQLIQGELDFE